MGSFHSLQSTDLKLPAVDLMWFILEHDDTASWNIRPALAIKGHSFHLFKLTDSSYGSSLFIRDFWDSC